MARSSQFPPVTKLVLLSITAFSLLTFVLRYSSYIHIIAAESHNDDHSHLVGQGDDADSTQIPSPQDIYVPIIVLAVNQEGYFSHFLTKPWVFFTTTMIENSIISYITTATLFAYMTRYIETLWGSRELIKYLALNIIGSNILCFTYFSFKQNINHSGEDITITGGISLIMSLIIAIKQRIPNQYLLFLDGSIRIGVSLIPFWILIFISACSLFIPNINTIAISAWSTFAISWIYLRFWKEGGSGRQLSLLPTTELETVNTILGANLKGDRTSQFALYTFFPYPLSIIIKLISSKLFLILVKWKILSIDGFSSEFDDEIDNNSMTQQDLVSSMSDSKIFTSSSLKGVTSKISMFRLPNFLKLNNDVESQKNLDHRREIALKVLNNELE